MLVSNTETTTSLSRRTSLTAFLTASSNSSSLFNTCSRGHTEGGEGVEETGSLTDVQKTLESREKWAGSHHQRIEGVNQSERKPAETEGESVKQLIRAAASARCPLPERTYFPKDSSMSPLLGSWPRTRPLQLRGISSSAG